MAEKLTIKLTREERKKAGGAVAYEFSVQEGYVVVRECWEEHDEIYSDGVTVAVPTRVWTEAFPWLAERSLPIPMATENAVAMGTVMARPLLPRFEARVDRTSSPCGCWIWTGSTATGYGKIRCNGVFMTAHRVSYMIYKGPIADGMLVCHTCDNRLCVNPDHLFLGDQSTNMRDMHRKGRSRGTALLTEELAIAIRDDQRTYKAIAEAYGVSTGTVWKIKAGRHWSLPGKEAA